ncbi:hypothetical protein ACQ4PT_063025 [Festuca glaucescens]
MATAYSLRGDTAGDAALVTELGKLSDEKRRYAMDPAGAVRDAAARAAAAALADEQRNLIRTYEITACKLEAELRARDADAERARGELAEEERVRPVSWYRHGICHRVAKERGFLV